MGRFYTLLVFILAVSCSKSEFEEDYPVNRTCITFNAAVSDCVDQIARSGLIDLPTLKSSSAGFTVSTNGLGTNMNNVVVKYNANAWSYIGDYYWPVNPAQNASFTAYAPAGTTGASLSSSGLTVTNFTPNTTIANQVDLIYAPPANFNQNTSGASGVSLGFKHILTQLAFTVKATGTGILFNNPKVESLVLEVPRSRGSYNGSSWTPSSYTQSYTIFNNTSIGSTPVESAAPLLLVPHTLPNGTKIIANISYTWILWGQNETRTFELNQQSLKTWSPGTKVTYNITINSSGSQTPNAAKASADSCEISLSLDVEETQR